MARVVPFPHPIQQQATVGAPRARSVVGRVTAVGAVFTLLSFVGSFVLRTATRIDSTMMAWLQARRQREADRQLWSLAQSDARLMADLVALQQHAEAQAH